MQKNLLTLLLCLLGTVFAYAGPLSGTWVTTDISSGVPVNFEISFNDKNAVNILMAAHLQEDAAPGVTVIMDLKVTATGTYTTQGDKVKLNISRDNVKVNSHMDVTGVDAATKKQVMAAMNGALDELRGDLINTVESGMGNQYLPYEVKGNKLLFDDTWLDRKY